MSLSEHDSMYGCAQVRNPFVFQYVRQLRHDRIDDSGPCVLLATPSMLQVPLSAKFTTLSTISCASSRFRATIRSAIMSLPASCAAPTMTSARVGCMQTVILEVGSTGQERTWHRDQGQYKGLLCSFMSACPAQSGTSRTHFEMWCEDRRNGVIIADFAVQGTLAREILGSPSEVMTRAGVKVGPL